MVGCIGTMAVLTLASPAWADSPSDARAKFVPGNAVTCAGVGLSADSMASPGTNSDSVSGTVHTNSGPVQPGTGQEVDVTVVGPDVVVDMVVVKGGDGYNEYEAPADLPPQLPAGQHYIPPLTNGGKVPTVGHWFACYHTSAPATLAEFPYTAAVPAAAALILGAGGLLGLRRRRGSGPTR